MGINGRFQMVDSTFGYNKTYKNAIAFINKTFIHPERITFNQMEDIAERFNITFNNITEIINKLIEKTHGN
jgi:DNA-binding MarR family transcriptional regulator